MNFCNQCNNMYYIRLANDDDSTLIYYCRKCGNEDTNLNEDSICVSKTYYTSKEQEINSFINKYTKYDPTLPRIFNMKCPNVECDTNDEESPKKSEIVSLRYDNINMKYLYICSECDFVWKNTDYK